MRRRDMTVTPGVGYPDRAEDRMTIDGMTPAHAKPVRKDRLWVLGIVAICCLIKVWPSWVGIGAAAGFPVIGGKHGMPTDWTLAVIVEAYWAYAVYAWLAAPAGRRSTAFAMGSAAGVFVLSLIGQGAEQWMAASAVAAFANDMPVLILALIAVLVHLRHVDRAESEATEQAQRAAELEAHEEGAAADERAALRAELEAAQAALETERQAASAAAQRAEQAEAKTERLTRKLAGQNPNRTRTKNPNEGRRTDPNAAPNGNPNSAPETRVPKDVNARTEALGYWLANPDITGAELGEKCGRGERWGQMRKAEFAAGSPA